ncbi:hypothetical protein I3760_02G086900 [Carya illinoinensis]|nr:hypothetical protein I3760_02G086900 [Carya illinoinensis]
MISDIYIYIYIYIIYIYAHTRILFIIFRLSKSTSIYIFIYSTRSSLLTLKDHRSMASSTDPKSDQEYGKGAPPPPQPRPDAPAVVNYFAVDVALRVLLFAAAVTGVVVIVTSDQTKWVPSINGGINGFGYRKAKFNHSPAFIYYVVAMSIAGLYALITILASISVLFKPNFQTKLLLHLAFLDVVTTLSLSLSTYMDIYMEGWSFSLNCFLQSLSMKMTNIY